LLRDKHLLEENEASQEVINKALADAVLDGGMRDPNKSDEQIAAEKALKQMIEAGNDGDEGITSSELVKKFLD